MFRCRSIDILLRLDELGEFVAGLKETVTFLEEEMVINQVLSILLGQGVERVILTLQLTVELGESFGYFAFNFFTVSSVDVGTERVVSEVSSNTDSSRVDHGILISGESRGVQGLGVHVKNVLVLRGVTVVILDDLVEEMGERIVTVVTTGIDTYTLVGPLGSGEDSLLESVAKFIFSILALLPDVFSQSLREDGGGS